MLYLLDANVLITAHNLYYPIDAVPEFWGSVSGVFLWPSCLRSTSFNKLNDELKAARRFS